MLERALFREVSEPNEDVWARTAGWERTAGALARTAGGLGCGREPNPEPETLVLPDGGAADREIGLKGWLLKPADARELEPSLDPGGFFTGGAGAKVRRVYSESILGLASTGCRRPLGNGELGGAGFF